jgi:hypothetical protein
VSQQVAVVSMKKLIDTGKAKATLSGYLGGYGGQDDSLTVTAIFLDQSGKRLGSVKIGPVSAAARKLQTGILKKTATRVVPKKTRTMKVVLGANRTAGNYNDGYADNLSLTIGR